MKHPELCLQTPEQLNALKLSVFPFLRKNVTLVIDDTGIPEDHRSRWEKELNERYEDCGCHQAGIGFTLGAILYLLWIVIGPVRLIDLGYRHLWPGLITAVIGLTIGKITGFYLARKRFRQTITKIQQNWTSLSRQDLS